MSDIVLRSNMTVKLQQHMGNDKMVVAAARVSTSEDIQAYLASNPKDEPGLINFLMKNRHGTPFEHNAMTFYVEAPIFVFREWHRHRIGWSYNEASGRYKELSPIFWVPTSERPLQQVGKPGHYTFVKGTVDQHNVTAMLFEESYKRAYSNYTLLLKQGVAKEVARAQLPVGIYSSMWATCNARSLMSFLSLRTKEEGSKFPSYPQAEIEECARKMEAIFAERFPLVYRAFVENGRVSP